MKIMVFGAGMMGKATTFDLAQSKDVLEVIVADMDKKKADAVKTFIGSTKVKAVEADASDIDTAAKLMHGCDAVISAVTYRFNYGLAKAAVEAKTNFCDLGGNNTIVEKELALDADAKKAGITIIPDCGLAPGLVSILAADALSRMDKLDEVHLRVGGLPQHPQPPLNYKIVFSPSGLINEYKEQAIVIKDGKVKIVESMEDLEEIEFPAPFGKLEAFNTSGGTSTLPMTFLGKVKDLDYKTIRYKGHCELIRAMLKLGLADEMPMKIYETEVKPRDVFEKVLEKNLTDDDKDLILLKAWASGIKDSAKRSISYTIIDYHDDANNITAMMRMTAYPASIIAQMMASGKISAKGAVPQELCVPTGYFIEELRSRGINIDIKVDE